MEVCPNCYTSVGENKKTCPFCGYMDTGDDLKLHRSTWQILLQFTLVVGVLMGAIVVVDKMAGGLLFVQSNCGSNEQCLISGLAICNTVSASPNAFGIESVEVKGKQGSLCVVDVHLFVQDSIYEGTKKQDKTCAFPLEQTQELGVKDLYMCKNYDGGASHDQNLIQGAFLPLDEQVPPLE